MSLPWANAGESIAPGCREGQEGKLSRKQQALSKGYPEISPGVPSTILLYTTPISPNSKKYHQISTNLNKYKQQ